MKENDRFIRANSITFFFANCCVNDCIDLELQKSPIIAGKIRIVWLGSNFPDPGEYNLLNDIPALLSVLQGDMELEIIPVRSNQLSETSDAEVNWDDFKKKCLEKGM